MRPYPVTTTFLLSLLATQALTQIVYTDIVPDTVFSASGDTCHLDLDNDGTADFLIRFYRSSGNCLGTCAQPGARPSWVKIDPLFNNEVADTIAYASQLDTLDPIDTTLTWSNTSDQILKQITGTHCMLGGCAPNPPILGQWTNLYFPKYLGLRFSSAGGTYFGWARLKITAYINSFTLLDYAYNAVPDEPILAGDTGSISTGLAQNSSTSALIVPNPTTGKFAIEGLDKSQTASVEIRNAMGQEVKRSEQSTVSAPRSTCATSRMGSTSWPSERRKKSLPGR